jgi:hypothetical protein
MAHDGCPRSRSNDPATVAVEFAYSSACELLQGFGFTEAAFALAQLVSLPGHVNNIVAEARSWAPKGGALSAREWRDEIIRKIGELPPGKPT